MAPLLICQEAGPHCGGMSGTEMFLAIVVSIAAAVVISVAMMRSKEPLRVALVTLGLVAVVIALFHPDLTPRWW